MTISAKFYVSVNGGANQDGGIEVPSAATIDFVPGSIVGWLRARWEIYDYPEGWTVPSGWSEDANGTFYYSGITPPQVTLPSNVSLWGKFMLRVLVNEQIDDDQNIIDGGNLLDDSTALSMLSTVGLRDIGAREKAQFCTETTLVKNWLRDLQRNWRVIEQEALLDVGPTASNASTGTLSDIVTTSAGEEIAVLVFTGAGAKTLTGFASPSESRVLYVKNAGSGTMTFAHETTSTAANRITTPNAADVTIGSGKSAVLFYNAVSSRWELQGAISDFGSQDVTTTGSLSVGSSPSTTGYLRVPMTGSETILGARFVGVDYGFVTTVANVVKFGSTAFLTTFQGHTSSVLSNTGALTLYGQGALGATYYSDRIESSLPRHGASTPYASEGRISMSMSDANQTVAAATYARKTNRISGALTAARTATYPHPSGESNSYDKFIENLCTGANLVISTGTGTTVTLVPGESLLLEFSPSGVRRPETLKDANPNVFGFRLSGLSGTPVPTTDQTNVSTIYLTPYVSGYVALYDGTGWKQYYSTQISLALSGLTANTNYDVFVNYTGSALALSLVAWSTATARATALGTQNGVPVKGSDATYRYVGTIRTTSTTQTQDKVGQRFISNYYNRVPRHLYVVDTTDSWTYVNPNNVWRQVNSSTANAFEYVTGFDDSFLEVEASGMVSTATNTHAAVGVGLDSTTANSAQLVGGCSAGSSIRTDLAAYYKGYPGVGYHKVNWLETGFNAAVTFTFWGDVGIAGGTSQTGMIGRILM